MSFFRTLEEYFYDHCITSSQGGDIDDEEFAITVNFRLFGKPSNDKKGSTLFAKKQKMKGIGHYL